ncbi:MAG: hypothetical protein HZA53_11370, partial [Planctomycetes bacterium]|nr:hypothetical protein [Planctomycetota bacterium]
MSLFERLLRFRERTRVAGPPERGRGALVLALLASAGAMAGPFAAAQGLGDLERLDARALQTRLAELASGGASAATRALDKFEEASVAIRRGRAWLVFAA